MGYNLISKKVITPTWNSFVFVLSGAPVTIRERHDETAFHTAQRPADDLNKANSHSSKIDHRYPTLCLTFCIRNFHGEGSEFIDCVNLNPF